MIWLIPAGYLVALVVIVRFYLLRTPNLADYQPNPDGPPVTVIIPARNEARNIEACVTSILTTGYRRLEVVVVDDQSTDDTAARVSRLITLPGNGDRLRLVHGAKKPDGWFGKQWALVQGFRAARPGKSDLLIFADADTQHTPELIPRAVAVLAKEKVDLMTVLPRQAMETFWERIIQPHVFFALGLGVGDFRRVNRTRHYWKGIANGQFILTPRKTYEAVGTHEAVKDTVADDLALAQAYIKSGRDIFLVHAFAYMMTRMYTNLREIYAGWSKNLASGAPLMMPPIGIVRAVFPWVMWVPSLAWLVPPVILAITGAIPWLVVVLLSLAIWGFISVNEKVPIAYSLFYPLGAAVMIAIMIRSAIRGRHIEWKGRSYGP
ncbi:MAG TPA: glycosyltransferase family 2 protein [Gemmatimonadales bacterium]|nr:glycosyltransferase family 2 protein [Gemmatimonadales bacterium]